MQGTVVAAHGRQYLVLADDGRRVHSFPRGKKSEIACGDRVELSFPSPDQGCIEKTLPRGSLLYRSNEFRQKLIAANLTQVVIVVASEPPFSEEVLNRCLVAAEEQHLRALIVLNKSDLTLACATAERTLAPYARLGYRVIRLSAREDVGALRNALIGQASVLVGQSGMGKSTLTNALVPGANAATREISVALQSGKHTTTHATLYALDDGAPTSAGGWFVDSPGLQEFGLAHLDQAAVEQAMPEFRNRIGQCRFRDCRHDREPECAIRRAVDAGDIAPARYAVFRQLTGGG
jgi:ribosome biogenesis GTPase / thiamine phosphate phosphatase